MPQTYTPLQPNQAPAYGTSGQAVADLQHNYNVQNQDQAGWTPLAEDGQYGPLTQAGVNWKPANPGIMSSSSANSSLMQDGNKLDQMTNGQDPYMEYLQKKANGLMGADSQPGADEKNAASTAFKEQQKTQNDYAAYKAGLETLGIQSGLSQGAPSLQMDRMLNAANSETQKLADIQDKEDFAIAKAKQARLDNDAKTLKDTLSEINQLKKDKAAELENQLTRQSKEFDVAMQHAPAAYATYMSLSGDKQEAYINQYATELGISPKNFVDALVAWNSKKKAGKDDGSGTGKFTYTSEDIKNEFTKNQLFDMALASGIERKRNLSKGNEIDEFLSAENVVKINKMLNAINPSTGVNYTADEIYEYINK